MDEFAIGVATNLGLVFFIALSAYLVLLTGEVSFGQQGFFGLGAYCAAIATAMFDWPLAIAVAIGIAVGSTCSTIVGILTLRLRGTYFAIATLAFAEMLRIGFELLHWQHEHHGVRIGPDGAQGFRGIRWAFEHGVSAIEYLAIVWCIVGGLLMVFSLLERTKAGVSIRALGQDPELAAALGLRVTWIKLSVVCAAGGLAALGGALFAHHNTYIEPSNFNIMLGVHSLAYPIIGGLGTALGPLLGVLFDIGVLESSRVFGGFRMTVFGGVVALVLWWRPRGLLDESTVHKLWTTK
jgi:branched-chain amino acid transport system permease protein